MAALDLSRAEFTKLEEGEMTTDTPDSRSHCTRTVRLSVVLVLGQDSTLWLMPYREPVDAHRLDSYLHQAGTNCVSVL